MPYHGTDLHTFGPCAHTGHQSAHCTLQLDCQVFRGPDIVHFSVTCLPGAVFTDIPIPSVTPCPIPRSPIQPLVYRACPDLCRKVGRTVTITGAGSGWSCSSEEPLFLVPGSVNPGLGARAGAGVRAEGERGEGLSGET